MRQFRRHAGFRFALTAIPSALIVFLIAISTIGGARGALGTGPKPGDPQPRPTMTDEQRAERFHPGPVWQGKGHTDQGITQDEAERFADFPVFWLGDSFAGYNLQAIVRNKYTPTGHIPSYEAMDTVGFAYGECTIPEGTRSCTVPIVIMTEPVCVSRPEWIAEGMLAGPVEIVGSGAQMLRFRDGHVRLWASHVSITIHARVDPSLVDGIVDELRGINSTTRSGDIFAAPDFSSCPPTEEVPSLNPPSSD